MSRDDVSDTPQNNDAEVNADNIVVLSAPITLTINKSEKTYQRLTVQAITVADVVNAHEDVTDELDIEDATLAVACDVPLDVIDNMQMADYDKAVQIFQRLNSPEETQADIENTATKPVLLLDKYQSDAGVRIEKLTISSIKVKLKKQAQRAANGNQARANSHMVAYACSLVPEDINKMSMRDFMRMFARFQLLNTYRDSRAVEATGSPAS